MVPFLIYLAVVSFAAFVLTVYDKLAAEAGRRRIPEAVLLAVGVIGGAFAEWLTMRLIRHKTRKKKFMITLPVLALLHAAAVAAAFYLF